jgi:hypothetical protein
MPALKVAIVRVVDEGQPGSVACRFADADGREHVIVEKTPVVTTRDVTSTGPFPIPIAIECVLLQRSPQSSVESGVTVDLAQPWGVQSNVGLGCTSSMRFAIPSPFCGLALAPQREVTTPTVNRGTFCSRNRPYAACEVVLSDTPRSTRVRLQRIPGYGPANVATAQRPDPGDPGFRALPAPPRRGNIGKFLRTCTTAFGGRFSVPTQVGPRIGAPAAMGQQCSWVRSGPSWRSCRTARSCSGNWHKRRMVACCRILA